jgi:hypothetical protein
MIQTQTMLKEWAQMLGYELTKKKNKTSIDVSETTKKVAQLNYQEVKTHLADLETERVRRNSLVQNSIDNLCKLLEKRQRSDLSRDLFIGSVVNRNRILVRDSIITQLDVDIDYLKAILKQKECEIIQEELFPEIPFLNTECNMIHTTMAEDGNLKLVLVLGDSKNESNLKNN